MSVSVEFQSVKPGCCAWCKRDKDEVFVVAFADKSFLGSMCKADLLRAITMKLENGQQAKPAAPTAAPLSK